MAKILVFVLGLGIVLGAAWWYLQRVEEANLDHASAVSAPKRQLDQVREAADRMEDEAQQRMEQLDERVED